MSRTGLQIEAMFLKNLAFMRRKTCQIVLLVISPIIFCLIITLIQYFFNIRVGSDPLFTCGCKCIACTVYDPSTPNQTRYIEVPRGSPDNPCPTDSANCSLADMNECGLQYSGGNLQQLIFCPVSQPSSWAPLLQVTIPQGNSQFLVSHSNRALARNLSNQFFTGPRPEARVQGEYLKDYIHTQVSNNYGSLCQTVSQRPYAPYPSDTPLQQHFANQSQVYLQKSSVGIRETFYGEIMSLQRQIYGSIIPMTKTLLIDPALINPIFSQDRAFLQTFVDACYNAPCSTLIDRNVQQLVKQNIPQSQGQESIDTAARSSNLPILGLGLGGLVQNLSTTAASLQDLIVLQDVAKTLTPQNNYFEIAPILTAIAMQMADLVRGASKVINLNSSQFAQTGITQQLIDQSVPFCQQPYQGTNGIVVVGGTQEINRRLYCGFPKISCPDVPKKALVAQRQSNSWDFEGTSIGYRNNSLNVDMYINESITNQQGGTLMGPNIRRLNQPLNMAAQAFAKIVLGVNNSDYVINLEGIMDTPALGLPFSIDISSVIGTLFFQLLFQLTFVLMVQQLVYEKEKRLRNMMRMHGLSDVSYWLVSFLFFVMLNIVYFVFTIIFGSFISGVDIKVELITKKKIYSRLVGLEFFRQNNYGVQAIFYILFAFLQTSFACFMSSIYSRQSTAVAGSFVYIFGNVLLAGVLIDSLIVQGRWWVVFLELIPPFGLYRGLFEFQAYSQRAAAQHSAGMTFRSLRDKDNGMAYLWVIFAVESFVFLVLSFYFDQVLNTGAGVKRHPLFFLGVTYKTKVLEADLQRSDAMHDDVYQESDRVRNLSQEEREKMVMLVQDLQKIYPSRGYGTKSKVAVKNLDLGIQRGECFGLLGPNGAGKSTTISMMIGYIRPTQGSIHIAGLDLKKNLYQAYQNMGVCPQDNCLWESLTGREHLQFYGRLKGYHGKKLEEAVTDALKYVNLYYGKVGEKLSATYSGGMKRRLSVAISFIGNPDIVFLDEPSTGLDPASRRQLWEAVKKRKCDRGILLTTHSMQEAEILCDRIGIFANGQLVVIGDPKSIRQQFGRYLIFQIIVPQSQQQEAKLMVNQQFPDAILTYEINGTFKYDMPLDKYEIHNIFECMQNVQEKGDLQVIDWAVHNASLEDVFIKVSKQAGVTMSDRQ